MAGVPHQLPPHAFMLGSSGAAESVARQLALAAGCAVGTGPAVDSAAGGHSSEEWCKHNPVRQRQLVVAADGAHPISTWRSEETQTIKTESARKNT
jgi:H+/Cl- antiporter ClcA